MELVYTLYPKSLSYFGKHILRYVLKEGYVPLSPIIVDRLDENLVKNANEGLVKICDGVWVFGPLNEEVSEITILAEKLNKPVRYFSIVKDKEIIEV